MAAGLDENGHAYVIKDVSGRYTPLEWASKVVASYWALKADRIVAETNMGGDMIETSLRNIDPNVSYKSISARQGKITRAEPVAACYEQGRVHHVGVFRELETELCSYTPGTRKSPDRMDALVHCISDLLINSMAPTTGMLDYYRSLSEAAKAGEIAGPEFGFSFGAAERATVRLIVPPGHTTIMLMSGHSVSPDRDGIICCPEGDARAAGAGLA